MSISSLAGKVKEASGRSTTAKLAWFCGMAYVFLWVPDIDLMFIGILHHRSIITHSILPALILLLLGRRAGAAPLSGSLIGLAVHLSCDMLSPMVGFAQIWLPAPIKAPLGPLSYLWLLANAVFAFWLARIVAMKTFDVWSGYALMSVVTVTTGFSYGFLNENSFVSGLVAFSVFLLSLLVGRRKLKNDLKRKPLPEKADNALNNIHAGVLTGLEKIVDGTNSVNSKVTEFSEDLDLKGAFFRQRTALEAALELSQSIAQHERERETWDDDFKRTFDEVSANWYDSEEKLPDSNEHLQIDLLGWGSERVLPRQIEELKRLQKEHFEFLTKLHTALLADPLVQARFTQTLLERQSARILEQILTIEKNA